MKILYLELHNYAGIFAGTGKTKITIDFRNSKNEIVMLFGKNGSGKSTILSALHPFMGSNNDERDNLIINGKDGYKEIHIKNNDFVYIIKHYTKKSSKSYIGKVLYSDYISGSYNIDELNENGGVRTFKEIVKDELNVTEDLFKLSRIGSNVTNFIDLSTADRKLFISKFLPDIEEYLKYYKIIKDKFSTLNKEIQFIANEMNKLDSESHLTINKNNYEKLIDDYDKELSEAKEKLAIVKGKIKLLDPDNTLLSNSYKNPKEDEKSKLESQISLFTNAYNIDELLNTDYESKLQEINDQRTIINEQIKNNKSNLSNILSDIDKIQRKINNLSIDFSDEYDKLINERQNEINDFESELKNIQIEDKDMSFDYNNILEVKLALSELINCAEDYMKSSNNLKSIKKVFITHELSIEKLEEMEKSLEEEFRNSNKTLISYNDKLNLITSNKDKELKNLELRPSNCTDDTCPFIKTAILYKDADEKIKEIANNIDQTIEKINKIEESKNKITKVLEACKRIKLLYERNYPTIISLSVGDKISTIDKYAELICEGSLLTINDILSVENLVNYRNINVTLNDLRNKLDVLIQKRNNYNTNKNIYDEYNSELNEKIEKRDSLNKLIFSLDEQYNDIDNEYDSLNKKCTAKANYLDCKSKLEVVNKEYNEYNNKINDILELIKEMRSLSKKIEDLDSILSSNKTSLAEVNLKLLRLKEYNTRKSTLNKDFEKVGLIKDALNPTKGIPIHFINNYLNKTKNVTNELLDLSQSSKFAINFDIDDKNFFIQVYKSDGTILNDIQEASQGECALTSLSLSLALMEQSMSNYNILYLDELDGALDTENRRAFIDMVSTQIKKLNMEQVFIISHNKEFDYYPVDLILLKNHDIDIKDKEIMSNKNILFIA